MVKTLKHSFQCFPVGISRSVKFRNKYFIEPPLLHACIYSKIVPKVSVNELPTLSSRKTSSFYLPQHLSSVSQRQRFFQSHSLKPCSHWLRQRQRQRQRQRKNGLHRSLWECSHGHLRQRQHQPIGSNKIHSFRWRCRSQWWTSLYNCVFISKRKSCELTECR